MIKLCYFASQWPIKFIIFCLILAQHGWWQIVRHYRVASIYQHLHWTPVKYKDAAYCVCGFRTLKIIIKLQHRILMMFEIQDLFSINSNALKDWLLLHFKKCRYVRCIFQINKIWQIKSKWATVRYNFFKFKQTKYNQLLNLGIQNGIYSSFGLWRPRKTNTVFSISNYTKAYWEKKSPVEWKKVNMFSDNSMH